MSYKAFLFDVDGTITRSAQVIEDEMAEILNVLPGEIGFISGTNIKELKRMITSKISRKHHLLGNTGTHYVEIGNEEREVFKEELNDNQKREIIDALKKLKEEYTLVPITSEEDQIQDRHTQITLSILGRNAPLEEKEAYDKDRKKREKFVDYLKKYLDENIYDIRIGGTTSIDITLRGRNKDAAIRNFIDENNISAEEIIFFGDQLQPGGNDYEAKMTGVECIEVKDPQDTLLFLKNKILLTD